MSGTQIEVAQELFKQNNLTFECRNAYDVPELLREINAPIPDLITIAQALHWFDPDKLY